MTPIRSFSLRSVALVTGVLHACFLSSLTSQANPTGIAPNPLDEINLSLRPLMQSAAAYSWRMDLQEILVRRAEAMSMRYSSTDKFRVSANFRAGYQRQDTATTTTDGMTYRFTVTARKPLYTWGATAADRQYGLLEVERVKQDRQLAFLAIYREVANRFVDYSVQRQRVHFSRLSSEIYEADVELRRGQVARGEFPATQFATMELGFAEEKLKHQTLVNTMEKSGNDLRELIGLEPGASIDIGGGIPAVADELSILQSRVNGFIESMDTQSIKVGSKQARLNQELERLKKVEVNQRPKLNGLFTVRRDSDNVITGNRQNLEYTESFAGLEFSWNIYDGKNTMASIKESMESKRQLERELSDLKRDLRDDIGYFLADLEIKREQSLLSDQKFYWEEGRYRQMEEDVKAGRSPEKELQAAKRDLERERIIQWDMRGRYYKSLTNLYVMLEYPSILAYLEE